MYSGEAFPVGVGADGKATGQDMLTVTDSQILRENAKLKQELAEAKDELKRIKDILADKEEHKKMLDQDAEFHTRYWLPEEHQRFLTGLKMYGHKDIKSIARFVGSRSSTQVRTHAQKYFMKLEKHGKSLGEMGLPDRPDSVGLQPSSLTKAPSEHTSADENGAVRKATASLLSPDPHQGGQGGGGLLNNSTPFFMQQGSTSGGGASLAYPPVTPGSQPPAPPGA